MSFDRVPFFESPRGHCPAQPAAKGFEDFGARFCRLTRAGIQHGLVASQPFHRLELELGRSDRAEARFWDSPLISHRDLPHSIDFFSVFGLTGKSADVV